MHIQKNLFKIMERSDNKKVVSVLEALERINLKNNIEKVLHTPFNYKGGMLEFAIVFDYHIPKEALCRQAKELITMLRTIRYSHSKDGRIMYEEIFRNARLNIIKWISNEKIIKEVSSMGLVQMGRCFDDYSEWKTDISNQKSLDKLTGQLKMFYARSKIIFVITDKSYEICSPKVLEENLQPFLKHKLVYIDITPQNA